jgi:FlaA1/EpsC-like NDP-sugar epimerase
MKKKIRTMYLVFLDVILINFSILFAFFFRFGFEVEMQYIEKYLMYFPQITIIKLIVFAYFHLYKSLWKYASIDELLQLFNGVVVANTLTVTYLYLLRVEGFPRSIILLMGILDLFLIGASRLSYRVLRRFKNKYLISDYGKERVLIVGAGQAGTMLAKEFISHVELNAVPVAFLDDDPMKKGNVISGVEVKGSIDEMLEVTKEMAIDEIVIAVPSADQKRIRAIVNLAKESRCQVKILPHMGEILSGNASLTDLRDINIEDLLGRDPVELDIDAIERDISGKEVLVTGGGGSIGSEICRQVARFSPKKLIIFDIYENNAYDIQNELLREYNKSINLDVVIGSVRDRRRVEEVIKENNIDLIFHAAAHKHVPLMERSPKEAIKNNIFGTKNVSEMAKFVLISTDKAVNPTNIMGATKRACEILIQNLNNKGITDFVAVRFGNVLGSNGSVIPLFKKQIKDGGPVTVTHEEVIRYFMTIPEASKLVLQAGAMAKGGEIFILDMGEPTKIIDLAKDLIKLSGFEPYVDIDIEIIGLRPGEKMFEELLVDEENHIKTTNKKIFIEKERLEVTDDYVERLNRFNIEEMSIEEIYIHLNKLTQNFNYTRGFSQQA